jgi:hypothetical protein
VTRPANLLGAGPALDAHVHVWDALGFGAPHYGMLSGEQVASTLACFATVDPDEAWTELDAC